jgi:hypothetical protein
MHVPDNRSRLATQPSLIVRCPNGSTEGDDPRQLSPEHLAAAGHVAAPLLKVLRAKCLDCSAGDRSEVARCTAVGCALWPYRMGTNPFGKPRGQNLPGVSKTPLKLRAFPPANGHPRAVEPSAPAEIGGDMATAARQREPGRRRKGEAAA